MVYKAHVEGGNIMQKVIEDNINKCTHKVMKKKKNMLKMVISSKNILNKSFIIRFLLDDTLDSYIERLDEEDVLIGIDSFIKKGFLTSEEQFISILDNFITYFFDIVSDVNFGENVFKVCINTKVWDIFLDKKYFYDNDNMEYFYYHFNLIIIDSFYHNLNLLKNDLIYELDSLSLDMNRFYIKRKSDVKKIVTLLSDICFVNKNRSYMLFSLFNRMDRSRELALNHFEILFSNYFKNIRFLMEYHNLIANII